MLFESRGSLYLEKFMKIQIIGNGAFGSFLKELLAPHCEIAEDAETVILAVPASAYEECGKIGRKMNKHLVNVCSVQKPTTDTLLRFTNRVTSIHPLFGRRTPADKRNSILTHTFTSVTNDVWFDDQTENDFLEIFRKVSTVWRTGAGALGDSSEVRFTPESHDILMAKTHASAVMAAKQLKVFTDRVANVPDELIPNSFRLMRQFVQTLDDMPTGTIESIMANPYI